MHTYTIIVFSLLASFSLYPMKPVQFIPSRIQLIPSEQPENIAKEMYVSINSSLLKSILVENNPNKLREFLEKNTSGINPVWSGYIFTGYSKNKKETVLDYACKLGNIDLINHIVKASRKDCFLDVIDSMAQYYKVDLLKLFIEKNGERSRQQRFSIWRIVLDKKTIWKKTPNYNEELELAMFKSVFSLLFYGGANVKNEEGETLLHIAVKQAHEGAVKFLLERHADPSQRDNKNVIPLFYAGNNCAITKLLQNYTAQD